MLNFTLIYCAVIHSQCTSTAAVTIRVIMVVGVKDSDMEGSDVYVIEDTVVDYAMVGISIHFYISHLVRAL